jgi:hypothetical protein
MAASYFLKLMLHAGMKLLLKKVTFYVILKKLTLHDLAELFCEKTNALRLIEFLFENTNGLHFLEVTL